MHIFTRNIQWNLHTYAISNLQSEYILFMGNVVHYRGTKRFIMKQRIIACNINGFNHKTIALIIYCLYHRFYLKFSAMLKNWRGPRRSLLTGKIGVRQQGFPGHMKQKAGSPKVKRCNQRRPAWQMMVYHCTLLFL